MSTSTTKKETVPPDTDRPKLLWHEPSKQYGFYELHIPLARPDFQNPSAFAAGVIDFVDAINAEIAKRTQTKATAEKEQKEAEKAKIVVESEQEQKPKRDAEIAAFVADPANREAIDAKRREIGREVLGDVAAAMIIMRERGLWKATKAASNYEPPTACPTLGKLKYWKGDMGTSAYIEPSAIPKVLEWLRAIPYEIRHRKAESKYPAISQNGKYLMVNDIEIEMLIAAAKKQNVTPEEGK